MLTILKAIKLKTTIEDPVITFTIPNSEAEEFSKEMIAAARSIDAHSKISQFLHKHYHQKNQDLYVYVVQIQSKSRKLYDS